MTIRFHRTTTLALASTLALLLPIATAQAQTVSKASYNTDKTRISATYKADKAACAAQSGNARDICLEEAKGKEKVALAELQHSYSGKAEDQIKLRKARAEADYAVAKEKCDDLSGNAKDVCVKEAKAVEAKALANAKMNQQIGEARTDAADTKRDADYKVAVEKCDALSGDAKTSCMMAAKAHFTKK